MNEYKETIRLTLAALREEGTADRGHSARQIIVTSLRGLLGEVLANAINRYTDGKKGEAVNVLRYEISEDGYHGKARAELVAAVAEAFGCKVATINNQFNKDKDTPRVVLIVGTVSARKALGLVLPEIVATVDVLSSQVMNAELKDRKDGRINGVRRDFRRSYMAGFGYGVAFMVRKLHREIRNGFTDSDTVAEIQVAEQVRVEAKFAELYPVLHMDKGIKLREDGWLAGRMTGYVPRDGVNIPDVRRAVRD
ncbi:MULTISPECIES: hypothetical protein [unclassified Crossiella]|uniref:hypothetical protein n=1 Tax=unclassified Crossiella TaxID=2620835 RepID=UPI001FFE732A|nr:MULTISPECIES: hypothetical protein [unclassified Crossiella]MCK2239384.1 hypothetical protein [Crossiella sp. S99.2]MCK2252079.1 hypothetical protein [Crossiella sp. S99.1]